MKRQLRLFDRVERIPFSGCWLWTGFTQKRNGYGRCGKGYAHRMAWEKTNGKIPAGLNVLHRCDVPCCINPNHLFLGTQKQNYDDVQAKGRFSKTRRKLAPAQVLSIRADGRSVADIATDYGISYSHASNVIHGYIWKTT